MSYLGPVEAGNGETHRGTGAPDDHEVIDAAAPHRRGIRVRRALLTAAGCAVLAAAALNLLGPHRRSAVTPAPDPVRATRISYAGTAGTPDRATRSFALRIRISVAEGPPVTVESVRQPFMALTTAALPETPFTVTERHTRAATLRITVTNCSATPTDVRLPFLTVTLRNARDIRKESFVLSRAYATDVAAAIGAVCGPSVP